MQESKEKILKELRDALEPLDNARFLVCEETEGKLDEWLFYKCDDNITTALDLIYSTLNIIKENMKGE